jgi:spermidine synthase
MLQPAELASSMRSLQTLFREATCTVAAIPTYVGGFMAMGFASDDTTLRKVSERVIAARYRRAGRFPTRYWTPSIHCAAFALPRFIERIVTKAKA